MIALAVVALICGTVLLIGYRAERVLSAKWDDERFLSTTQTQRHYDAEKHRVDADAESRARSAELEARRVAVSERELTLKERQFEKDSAPPPKQEPMPDDLMARIEAWGTNIEDGEDPFAQDNERQTIMALYNEFHDWDKVRQKLAPMPRAA